MKLFEVVYILWLAPILMTVTILMMTQGSLFLPISMVAIAPAIVAMRIWIEFNGGDALLSRWLHPVLLRRIG